MAPKYPHNSPYAFSENRVIDGVELEGLEFDVSIMPRFSIPRLAMPRGITISIPRIATGPTIPPPPIFLTPTLPQTQTQLQPQPLAPTMHKIGPLDDIDWTGGYKVKKSKAELNNKKKDDIPEWSKGHSPRKGEDGKGFAERLLDRYYGKGKWSGKGPGSEFNKLKKYGDWHFKATLPLLIGDVKAQINNLKKIEDAESFWDISKWWDELDKKIDRWEDYLDELEDYQEDLEEYEKKLDEYIKKYGA